MIKDELRLIARTAFGAWDPTDGIPGEEIERAERSLGLELPEPLRDFYEMLGRQPQIMDEHFHFKPLGDLEVEHDALVFCSENQWTVHWGIQIKDLELPNPPVRYHKNGNWTKWYGDARRCSAFLIHNVCWQGVMALPETVWVEMPEERLPKLETLFSYIGARELRGGYTKLSLIDEGRRMLASYLRMADKCYVGAVDLETLEDLEERSGFELEWL